MIKFEVKNRFTGDVQFTAEIDCEEDSLSSVKLGLAVKWAVKNSVNLGGADLGGADLGGADLRGVDLRGVNLKNANLWGSNMRNADLGGADLRDTNHIIMFGGVGEEKRVGYAVKHETCVMVQLGCFWGTEKEALSAIKKKYGARSAYAQLVRAACRVLKEQEWVT